jgi:hypothetical protein
MKFLLVIAASIAGIVVLLAAVVAIIGAFLPERHEVARSKILAATPAEVYRVVAEVEKAPTWRREIERVELIRANALRPQFREYSKHGVVTYEIIENAPGRKLVTRIVDRNLGYSGSWTYAFAPHGSGTELTITERGDVSNVMFRFMSRFVFGHTSTIDTYLAALSRYMESRSPA